MDATIIDAPSSTTNKAKVRDPEMSSNKKGNDWYFGSEEDQKTVRWGLLRKSFQIDAGVGLAE